MCLVHVDGSQERVNAPPDAEDLRLVAFANPPGSYPKCVDENGRWLKDQCHEGDRRLEFWYAVSNGDLIYYANENDGVVLFWRFARSNEVAKLVDYGYLECD